MSHPDIPSAAPAIAALTPYQSARMLNAFDPSMTYIDANELPYAPPEIPLDYSELHYYADAGPRRMIDAYAAYAGLSAKQLVATRGIDEGIDLLVRTYLEPGEDSLLLFTPTYGMYAVAAATHRITPQTLPLKGLIEPDHDAVRGLDALPKLIILCRPNNPTGALMSTDAVKAILDLARGRSIVAIDEAYIEFCPDESLVPLMAENPHLVIMRTLSKGFGLAGIHTGFLLAHEAVVDAVNRISNPYPIPDPCAQIALAALTEEGLARLNRNIAAVTEARATLYEALARHPDCLSVMPSAANFLLTEWRAPEAVWDRLTKARILARGFVLPGEDKMRIRFSIGTADQVQQVIEALGE